MRILVLVFALAAMFPKSGYTDLAANSSAHGLELKRTQAEFNERKLNDQLEADYKRYPAAKRERIQKERREIQKEKAALMDELSQLRKDLSNRALVPHEVTGTGRGKGYELGQRLQKRLAEVKAQIQRLEEEDAQWVKQEQALPYPQRLPFVGSTGGSPPKPPPPILGGFPLGFEMNPVVPPPPLDGLCGQNSWGVDLDQMIPHFGKVLNDLMQVLFSPQLLREVQMRRLNQNPTNQSHPAVRRE